MSLTHSVVTPLPPQPKLCNKHITKSRLRAYPASPLSTFFVEKGGEDFGIGKHILSFLGLKRGDGDLRGACNHHMFMKAMEASAFLKSMNLRNMQVWGFEVDEVGQVTHWNLDLWEMTVVPDGGMCVFPKPIHPMF